MILKTTGQCTGAVVKVPESLCRGFRDSCSFQQEKQWHLSLACSNFAKGDLPHQAGPRLVAQNPPHALVVVVSDGLSLDRAQEHGVNSFLCTCFPRNPARTSAKKKRSVDVGCNGSPCSTTTQRLQQSDGVHSSISRCFCSRRTNAFRQTDDGAAHGSSRIPKWTS